MEADCRNHLEVRSPLMRDGTLNGNLHVGSFCSCVEDLRWSHYRPILEDPTVSHHVLSLRVRGPFVRGNKGTWGTVVSAPVRTSFRTHLRSCFRGWILNFVSNHKSNLIKLYFHWPRVFPIRWQWIGLTILYHSKVIPHLFAPYLLCVD